MSDSAPFEPVAELLQRGLSIHHVYGDPVERGDTTVIPVAKVAYGFGAGGGRGPRRGRAASAGEQTSGAQGRAESQGSGGGGGVRMTPVGALEIGPHGTRFVRLHPLAPWLFGAALGFVAGLLMSRRP